MIEMRWVPPRLAKSLQSELVLTDDDSLRVLQYRYPVDVEKIPDIGKVHERVKYWSEWIDVPTVTEP